MSGRERVVFLDERVDESRGSGFRTPSDDCFHERVAELVSVAIARLRQAVGMKEQPLAGSERSAGCVPRDPVLDAERVGPAADAFDNPALRVNFQDLRVTGDGGAE